MMVRSRGDQTADRRVTHDDTRGYLLTPEARTLMTLLLPIQDWAKDWARRQ